ncbi:trna/rrna methyltransferase spou type [Trichococcus palustris]|uniref:Trna/rrna methyltransferase spou type n=2 Tax=Trichococcus palustris TaxID=140314 RepID=A0A143YYD3_9LACT|nr:trna/rrna methyltransferase spou type [Trichococcus palustris]SFK90211.1 23S rRNA (guanosine2251-2'-O)-methyltransferase [Trichococcus palustris]
MRDKPKYNPKDARPKDTRRAPKKSRPERDKREPVESETPENEDFVIGRHPVLEILKSERDINKIFIQEGLGGEKIGDIIHLAKERKIQIQSVPKSKLDTLSDNAVHQGVMAATAAFQYATLDDLFAAAAAKNEDPFFIILDSLEDPHNLGSVLRTADASGAHGVIIPKRRAVGLTSTVAKASTGAIEHVPVVRVTNLNRTIEELKERGVWIYATDMAGQDYRKWDTTLPLAIIIGNEGKGISRLLKESADGLLTIPMVGHVQSLNAGVAAGLMMYEVFRGRHK